MCKHTSSSGESVDFIDLIIHDRMQALEFVRSDDCDKELVNTAAKDGFMPLFVAMYYNDVDLCKALISRGADVLYINSENDYNYLHYAAACNMSSTIRNMLIIEGVNWRAKDKEQGYEPLEHAAFNKSVAFLEDLDSVKQAFAELEARTSHDVCVTGKAFEASAMLDAE